jgi:hypothetical protein
MVSIKSMQIDQNNVALRWLLSACVRSSCIDFTIILTDQKHYNRDGHAVFAFSCSEKQTTWIGTGTGFDVCNRVPSNLSITTQKIRGENHVLKVSSNMR